MDASGENPVRRLSGGSYVPVENDGDVPSRHRIRIRRPGRVDPAALPARWFGKYSMRARAGGHDRRPVELDDAALRQRTVGSRTRGPNFPKSGVRNDQAAIESIQTVISLAGAGGRYRAVMQDG